MMETKSDNNNNNDDDKNGDNNNNNDDDDDDGDDDDDDKLAVLELIEAMAMTTFDFCFSINAAIPFCVNIALTATIPTAANIDLSDVLYQSNQVECYCHNEIN